MENIQRYTLLRLPEVPYTPGINQRKTVTEQINSIEYCAISTTVPSDNMLFLFGVDLFNGGFFWETHEAWEELWHAEKDQEIRRTLQGLIQMSAGFVKVRQKNQEGLSKLFEGATDKISLELCEELGIDCGALYREMKNALVRVKREQEEGVLSSKEGSDTLWARLLKNRPILSVRLLGKNC